MTYDFFVFPSGLAEDPESAVSLYESAPDTGPVSADSGAAGFVDALGGSGHAFLEEVAGHGDTAYVRTSWDDPMSHLSVVAGAARDHGLAVLDVQLGGLYDPSNSVELTLDTQGGPQLPYVTRRIVRDVMAQVRGLRYHWVTLTRGDGVFVQTFRDDDGSWAVEHRDGTPAGHFVARTEDADAVETVLWSWARGDGRWQAMLVYAPVEL